MQYYISYSTFVDSRLFTLDTRILIFADFPRNYSNFDFCWSPKRLGTNPPLGYYPYYPYYLVVCLYMWYFIHYYPYYLVVCLYMWFSLHDRMQLKIKMLITLITGNKGKESKLVVVFQASFASMNFDFDV